MTLPLTLAAILSLPAGAAKPSEPPPGCVSQAGPGGCNGKSYIHDLEVWPPVSCLEISMNNCNGGMISARNGCAEGVSIGGVTVAPEQLVYLELFREGRGPTQARRLDGNYAKFSPAKNVKLSLKGKAGPTKFRLTYRKTKPLCP